MSTHEHDRKCKDCHCISVYSISVVDIFIISLNFSSISYTYKVFLLLLGPSFKVSNTCYYGVML